MSGPVPPMPLACRLLGHEPDPFPRWNEGYYFARCRRCDTQIVRTTYGRWQLPPRGSRIVWSTARPESLAVAPMLLDPAELLPESPPPPAPTRQLPPSYVPDFMEDAKTDTSWRRHLPPKESGEGEEPDAQESRSRRADIARLIPPLRRSAAARDAARHPARRAAVAIAIFSLLLIALMMVIRNDGARATAASVPQPNPIMFVTDGMTSCRAAASPDSDHIRYLVRGDAVELIERSGEWAAIAYGGQHCWLPRGLLSEQPLA